MPDSQTESARATRTETDSLGSIDIPADRYWGPQTERARRLFRIGSEHFPPGLIRAVGLHKWACAEANERLGELAPELAQAIRQAAEEIIDGDRDADFPLPVWQTGSGTQTNMNANEVISNRANEILGQPLGTRKPVHPNDHVNRGQSSNDNFPTMMHIAAVEAVEGRLLPALGRLHAALWQRAEEWGEIIKLGRTHMMDAVPMTLGQEAAAWARQVELGQERLRAVMPRLLSLPQGGTAVGTGLNRHRDFDRVFCEILANRSGLAFTPNPNKFEGMGAHDAFVELQGAMNTIAVSLNKIANDIRLLGSGPRSGLSELVIPADGLSSSIMPGKTNPTQSEALTMVCAQVLGNTTTVSVAGAQGHLELNVFKPVIIQAVLQSATLLSDAAESFAEHMVLKLEPNRERIAENLARSLMLVTALNPRIGYDKAVQIGKKALAENLTLKEAAQRLGHVSPEDFDRWVRPEEMVEPGATLDGGG
ncbi:class II fumarate hydratase [Siccirubricoccus sp. KC 17139]|uniref:Fumarate hydratase class II n=1 Tax=Siccirubricoccus soli TaxID=2899147 RepID=A0ABT1D3A7_9PROT|nr:class II fumarate hydratase [Siccirubricoccus soli]MCO6416405.1 class II fumarate hydratase [Siccirubricoccus soli]MCP2682539.1 class II fumarate hydratase [Siccirubricoccus soli]